MRTRLPIMVAALLLVSAGAKAQDSTGGQQDVPKQPPTSSALESEFGTLNRIDFGVRGTSYGAGSDQARYQRFQDLRDGARLDVFRFANNNNNYLLTLQADHVGYRDQRFAASYNNYGKLKASFEWNQIPLNFSYTSQSLYTSSSSNPGLLLLGDGIQSGIQNKTLTLPTAVAGAPAFNLQNERKVLDFKLTYSARKNLDLNLTFKNTLRDGTQPYAAGFGFGSATDEFPLPIDQRTTELGSNLEWTNGRAFAKAGYEGSFFRNNIPSLMWDNPVRTSDSATAGPLQGRLALAPDTNSNTALFSAGVTKLPGRSSANAYISVGNLTNNAPLIPYASNAALPQVPLPRTTADLSVKVTALNFSFTSRPTNLLWFSARYRQYGWDNSSSPFVSPASVNYDTSIAGAVESNPLGYTRHAFDADASYNPVRFVGIRGGYTRETINRTFRAVEKSTEDTGRVSVDLTGFGFATLRGVYEHSRRRGDYNYVDQLDEGIQPGLTEFDVSARNRDRFSAILVVTPISVLSFNASVSTIKDDYPTNGAEVVDPVYQQMGLLSSKNNVYQGGVDFVPIENRVTAGFSYGYEKNTARQGSRYAGRAATGLPASFTDPNYNWWDDNTDNARTARVSLDVLRVLPKVDVKLGYDYSNAESTYFYSGPYTIAAKTVQLPAVKNAINRASVDGTYHLTRHVGLGLVYWYEKFTTSDFALNPQPGGLAIPAANPSIVMVGYNYLPYNANTFMGRFTYLW